MAGLRPGSSRAEWAAGSARRSRGDARGVAVAVAFALPLALAAALLPTAAAAQTKVPRARPADAAQAPRQKQPSPTPAQIDRNGVLILIRSTLLALDHANKTGNYTVLRDLGAPGFQVNTAARLAEIFASQRRDKLDLSGVAAIDPQLSLLPQIEANGMMRFAGFFPSIPQQVKFEMLFAPVDGQWRLFGLSVGLGQTAAAPQPVQAAPAPTDGTAPKDGAPAKR
ncbi:MAG: hypothetical protein R3D62_19160 [Xanthobacteraceae bacterium]